MTTLEIIDETVASYNSKNRAVALNKNGLSACYYLTPDGKRCAIGRCLNSSPEAKELEKAIGGVLYIFGPKELDDVLQEKYHGHGGFFWQDIQNFHDNPDNWDETGLSTTGKFAVAALKKKWPN